MAAPAPAEKKKIIEVTIIKVKPKYMSQFVAGIGAGKALYEKHGAKVLGVFNTEAGPGPEVVFISQWHSLDARVAAYDAIKKDPEYAAQKDRAKFIYNKESRLCYARSAIPMRPFTPGERVMLKRFTHIGFPYQSENKFAELIKYSMEKTGSHGPLCLLHPVTCDHGGMLAIFELKGNKVDDAMDRYYKFISDPKHWPKLSEAHQKYHEESGRILAPLC